METYRTPLDGKFSINGGLHSVLAANAAGTCTTAETAAMSVAFPTVMSPVTNTNKDAFLYTYVGPTRVVYSSSISSKTSLGTPDGDASTLDAASRITALQVAGFNSDIILGSFYQANGDADAGATWCDNGEATNKTNFAVTLDHAATNPWSFKARSGFGPKSKCTW